MYQVSINSISIGYHLSAMLTYTIALSRVVTHGPSLGLVHSLVSFALWVGIGSPTPSSNARPGPAT